MQRGKTELPLLAHFLKTRRGENICFSPWSVSTALAAVGSGARSETASQLSKFLGLDVTNAQHLQAAADRANLSAGGDITLCSQNLVAIQSGYDVNADFLKVVTDQFKAKHVCADFKANPVEETKKCNDWVEANTKGKISNLLPDGVIDGMTRLVYLNAVYFKGSWLKAFDTAVDGKFRSSNGGVTAKMMTVKPKDRLSYVETGNYAAVCLPYRGRGSEASSISMLVVLPSDGDVLSLVEQFSRKENSAREIIASAHPTSLEKVVLPKFKVEFGQALKEDMTNLGVPLPFDERNADLSGIHPELYISEVFHKAFVEVNEEGTEAAAATAVVAKARCMPRPKPSFIADRPFMFAIYDEDSKTTLFVGAVNDPTQSPEDSTEKKRCTVA